MQNIELATVLRSRFSSGCKRKTRVASYKLCLTPSQLMSADVSLGWGHVDSSRASTDVPWSKHGIWVKDGNGHPFRNRNPCAGPQNLHGMDWWPSPNMSNSPVLTTTTDDLLPSSAHSFRQAMCRCFLLLKAELAASNSGGFNSNSRGQPDRQLLARSPSPTDAC